MVWPWPGAAEAYDPEWIVHSTAAAVERIIAFRIQPASARRGALARNRALVRDRYGTERGFAALTDAILGPNRRT